MDNVGAQQRDRRQAWQPQTPPGLNEAGLRPDRGLTAHSVQCSEGPVLAASLAAANPMNGPIGYRLTGGPCRLRSRQLRVRKRAPAGASGQGFKDERATTGGEVGPLLNAPPACIGECVSGQPPV